MDIVKIYEIAEVGRNDLLLFCLQRRVTKWRLGESLEEAKKSAETSNVLLNVSEFESIDDATESLVAMSSAYKDLEKIDIVDKLNEVGLVKPKHTVMYGNIKLCSSR